MTPSHLCGVCVHVRVCMCMCARECVQLCSFWDASLGFSQGPKPVLAQSGSVNVCCREPSFLMACWFNALWVSSTSQGPELILTEG